MIVWLSVAAMAFVLALVGAGIFYVRYRKGEVERADVIAGGVLIAVAAGLVVLSELIAGELSGLIFFLWIPFWLFWYERRRGGRI